MNHYRYNWVPETRPNFINLRPYGTSALPPPMQRARGVLTTIIGLNTAVFFGWQYAIYKPDREWHQTLYNNFTLSLTSWRQGRTWTLITSAFSHQNFSHILFNMFTLHSVGSILVYTGLGMTHTLGVCMTSAIAGSAAWLWHQSTRQPTGYQAVRTYGLGASGLVSGVIAAATLRAPFTPMSFMFVPVSIPLWTLTFLYVGVDTFLLNSNSGIGHAAHLGGALGGILYYALFVSRPRALGPMISSFLRRRRSNLLPEQAARMRRQIDRRPGRS